MKFFGRKYTFSLGVIFTTLSVFSLALATLFILLASGLVKDSAIKSKFFDEAQNDAKIVERSVVLSMRPGLTKAGLDNALLNFDFGARDIRAQLHAVKDIPVTDADLVLSRVSGQDSIREIGDGQFVRFLHPVQATKDCLSCHSTAKTGDTIGIIDITYPAESVMVPLVYSIKTSFYYTLFGMWLMFAILYVNLRFKLMNPITQMARDIRAITNKRDWSYRVPSHDIIELQSLADDFNQLICVVQHDHAQLEEISVRDPLTGLLNRRGFNNALEAEMARATRHGRPFSIVLIDLDNFKFINDTYGHPAGDYVLTEMASRMSRCLRKDDAFARMGGDEFVVILPETDNDAGVQVARKLHESLITVPFSVPEASFKVTASISVASYPRDGADSASLHAAVDAVLYKAKRHGKNQVVTLDGSPDEQNGSIFIGRTVDRLQRALDEGRVEVALQPIVSVQAAGGIVAYEALARIIENGVVIPAAEFIEAAEEAGLAKNFDALIFRLGLERLKTLPGVKMFFNFSAPSFGDIEWMRGLPAMLAEHGIECSRIVIEVTEREALPNMGSVKSIIDELRNTGIQFALDDFGSGFSSFLYVKHLNISYLKIDGSFVHQMSRFDCDRIIVESIQHIATQFGLKTVAEFVEDEATAKMLADIGVDTAQGYHFGRPKIGD